MWNRSLGQLVVASELAGSDITGCTDGGSACARPARLALALTLLLGTAPTAFSATSVGGGLANGTRSIAIGSTQTSCSPLTDRNYYLYGGSTTVNEGAIAADTESIAIGGNCSYPTWAYGDYSFAMGRDAKATAGRAQAWGYGSYAGSVGSIALGSATVINNASQGDGLSAQAPEGFSCGWPSGHS